MSGSDPGRRGGEPSHSYWRGNDRLVVEGLSFLLSCLVAVVAYMPSSIALAPINF